MTDSRQLLTLFPLDFELPPIDLILLFDSLLVI
jgi:hypothetical protein